MDFELRDGRRACERGMGPPRKCGAFDLPKLAEVPTTHGDCAKEDRSGRVKLHCVVFGGP